MNQVEEAEKYIRGAFALAQAKLKRQVQSHLLTTILSSLQWCLQSQKSFIQLF
jgi:hypothetical protein